MDVVLSALPNRENIALFLKSFMVATLSGYSCPVLYEYSIVALF